MFDELRDKALKITEALYRTTELFHDGEPLKWSLRQSAVEILEAISSSNTASIERSVKSICLKLDLAAGGSFISKVNFEVLVREYYLLMELVNVKKNSYQNLLDNILSDKLISDKSQMSVIPVLKTPSATVEPFHQQSGLTDRREAILRILKDNGPSSVGYIVDKFGGEIGEKTIQRELVVLVTQGTIKQDGEKRWRRYFL